MAVKELSPSHQNYLQAIWALQEWSEEPITPTILAKQVGVKLATVSEAVKRLASQGYLIHAPYGSIELSETGRVYAVKMIRRHRLLETFLADVLGYRWDEVHDEADALEHVVSDLLIDRIDRHLGYPTKDPHGDPIPDADGNVLSLEAKKLSEIEGKVRVIVERICDSDPELLQYFSSRGVMIGSTLEASEGEPFSNTLDLRVFPGGVDFLLGKMAAESVWVSIDLPKLNPSADAESDAEE